jgi:hypothetical protein
MEAIAIRFKAPTIRSGLLEMLDPKTKELREREDREKAGDPESSHDKAEDLNTGSWETCSWCLVGGRIFHSAGRVRIGASTSSSGGY